MNDQRPGLARPALLAGAIFGVVAGIPFIGVLNCLCCSWIIIAGLVGAYLYSSASKTAGTIFGPGEGALVGVLAGLVYAPVNWIVGLVFNLLFGGLSQGIQRALDTMGGQMEPEARRFLESLAEAEFALAGISLVVNLVTGALFGALGGVIGGLIFRVTPPAEGQQPPAPAPEPPAGGQEPPSSAPPPPPGDDKL